MRLPVLESASSSRPPVRRASRAGRLLGLVFLGTLAGCGGGGSSFDPSNAPNLVLISIDTMRPDFLGCYGYERDVSPAIDALATEGTVFEDVTSASPWTLPSHATMLTGQYPSTHGVETSERALTETTITSWLKQAGYQTFAVANAHNVGHPRYGLLAGFDPDHAVYVPEIEVNGGPIFNRAKLILQHGMRMLDARDPELPFFLFLHFYDVHTDFTPEERWRQAFVEPYQGDMSTVTIEMVKKRNKVLRGQDVFRPEDFAFLEQMYDAEIRTFDERMKVFFDYLEAKGLSDETVVCITSDHGEEYGEHGSILHGRTHYQELVRIPWILRGPGVPAGQRVERPVHLVDVVPTLLSLAGMPALPGVDGYDATLSWRDPSALPSLRYLFSEADHNNLVNGQTRNNFKKSVRLENWVLHYNLVTGTKELYDLEKDAFERNDLAAQEPERVQQLFEKLEAYMQREGSAKDIGEVSAEEQEKLEALGYGGLDE